MSLRKKREGKYSDVADEDVGSTEGLLGLLDQHADLVEIRYVRTYCRGSPPASSIAVTTDALAPNEHTW
ncbi:hypothetical protein [Rhodococcus erythropolis]|uniref:hypothetical protein n=1 Tax=Rhodococcus erythropolis TaxID=1833 RepID=UPI00222775E9|nr:hypothetical protein [Rhodococcus erythropolis]MCW2295435.1 hypothetical protein [Rhodococcus erythropolis]